MDKLEKYRKAWTSFQKKMIDLKRRQSDILSSITEKLDQQKIKKLMEKLKNK